LDDDQIDAVGLDGPHVINHTLSGSRDRRTSGKFLAVCIDND
jgi:hypothetical protein